MRALKFDVDKKKQIGGDLGALLKLESDPGALGYTMVGRPGKGERKEVYRDYLKASCMNGCIRERVLGYRLQVVGREIIWPSLQEAFDIGKAVHTMLQNSPIYFGDHLYGFWECQSCEAVFFGRRYNKKCPKCGASPKSFLYKEARIDVRRANVRYVGYMDLILSYNKGIYHIGEIKTESGNTFRLRKQPDIEHVFQTLCYMKYGSLATPLSRYIKINPDIGFLIYASKETQRTCPYKAFIIRPNPYLVEQIDKAMAQFCLCLEDESKLPAASAMCLDKGKFTLSTTAKDCPVREECFKHKVGLKGNID